MNLRNHIYSEFAGMYVILFGSIKYYQFMCGHTLKLFGFTVWACYGSKDNFWFRTVFEYGLSFKHISLGLTFSQRIGKKKVYCINSYVITVLKPFKFKATTVEDFMSDEAKEAERIWTP